MLAVIGTGPLVAGGITITARYTIASDGCGARAEPDDESRPPPLPGIRP
jgi:hypothetical protein